MDKRYITRIGPSGGWRLTQGRTYELDKRDNIIDDVGRNLTPAMVAKTSWSDVWDGSKPPPQITCGTYVGESSVWRVQGDTYAIRSDGMALNEDARWSRPPNLCDSTRWELFTDKPTTPLEPPASVASPQDRWVKRVGISNKRVTQEWSYKLNDDNKITDDRGKLLKPDLEVVGFWEVVNADATSMAPVSDKTDALETPVIVGGDLARDGADSVGLYRVDLPGSRAHGATFKVKLFELKTTPKEKKMLIIENDTRINGAHEREFDTGRIIDLIEGEKINLKRLEDLNLARESKAIAKLAAKHVDNIAALLEVLDAREA